MRLAEDLLLLLTDDDTGKHVVDTTRLDLALAGAVLVELLDCGAVAVTTAGDDERPGHLVVRNTSRTGDAVLDDALRVLAERPATKPADTLPRLAKGLRDRLLAGLVAAGVLRAEEGRVLGIFPTRRWPAAQRSQEATVRRGLHEVLVAGRAPTAREASLVGLLSALDALPAALGDATADRKRLKERAKAVAAAGAAGEAVRQALDDLDTMLAAATVTTTVTAAM